MSRTIGISRVDVTHLPLFKRQIFTFLVRVWGMIRAQKTGLLKSRIPTIRWVELLSTLYWREFVENPEFYGILKTNKNLNIAKKPIFAVAAQAWHSYWTKVGCDQTFTNNSERTFDIQLKYKISIFYVPVYIMEKIGKSIVKMNGK